MCRCTHTPAWHKEMKSCVLCGAEHDDTEVERISKESTRTFSIEQLAIIERMKVENEIDE